MPKFTKVPVVIEAEQFQGGSTKGVCRLSCPGFDGDNDPHVHTIHEGQLCAVVPGDWIIPEPDGEHFYPCKDGIFRKTYIEGEPSPIAALKEALKEEDYRYGWQANIAMAFVDEVANYRKGKNEESLSPQEIHAIANEAAINFLVLLCK